jgi:hypothetical protein
VTRAVEIEVKLVFSFIIIRIEVNVVRGFPATQVQACRPDFEQDIFLGY